jgi:hypothetical protein
MSHTAEPRHRYVLCFLQIAIAVSVSTWIAFGHASYSLAGASGTTENRIGHENQRTGSDSRSSEASDASKHYQEELQFLPGHRVIFGTVEEIAGDQIKVNIVGLQPRYLPLEQAREKGFPLISKGETLEIIVNDQNQLIDYHPLSIRSKHRILRGALVTPMVIGGEKAVVRTEDGKEEGYFVRPLAQSQVAALPIGSKALFFIDETNKIADATFGSPRALERAESEYQKLDVVGSPTKGAHIRIVGTIVDPLKKGQVSIKKENGNTETYEVRDVVQNKVSMVPKGGIIVLLIDAENKVVDAAVPGKAEQGTPGP